MGVIGFAFKVALLCYLTLFAIGLIGCAVLGFIFLVLFVHLQYCRHSARLRQWWRRA